MRLYLRHSFEGVILGFAPSRKRLWRSTVRLKAIADRPEVSALSLRVRLDPDREQTSLIGHDWRYGARQFGAKVYRRRYVRLYVHLLGPPLEQTLALVSGPRGRRASADPLGPLQRAKEKPRTA